MTGAGERPPDISALARRVDDLEAQLRRAVSDLDDLTAVSSARYTSTSGADPDAPSENCVEPIYSSVSTWVDGYLRVVFSRSIGGETRWCSQWHEHREAVTRLEALWRSWEALRLDPNLGIATWLTSYLDPQLTVLLSRSGTFAQCNKDRHTPCGTLGG